MSPESVRLTTLSRWTLGLWTCGPLCTLVDPWTLGPLSLWSLWTLGPLWSLGLWTFGSLGGSLKVLYVPIYIYLYSYITYLLVWVGGNPIPNTVATQRY